MTKLCCNLSEFLNVRRYFNHQMLCWENRNYGVCYCSRDAGSRCDVELEEGRTLPRDWCRKRHFDESRHHYLNRFRVDFD